MLPAGKTTRKSRKQHDPARTRERLLRAAFEEVYRVGFQNAGIDTILAATNVTKGALYHHFENKNALGHAIIEEIIAEIIRDRWLVPLQRHAHMDSIDALMGVIRTLPAGPTDVKSGCPLVNLAQEMSLLDEQFRKRLQRIFRAWQDEIAICLRRGLSLGTVRHDLDPDETANFLIAMIEGYEVLAKNGQDPKIWDAGIRNILGWLSSLRAPGREREG
jgi:TetR/AcrR family transcriptional regulator, transcriptional repressor for nem operon